VAGDAGRRALISRASHARLDEDDVRVRPGRGSRPRTRRRPAHEDAAEGFVAAVERGRYGVLTGGRRITAMRARELGRRGVVVGDTVALAGDVSGAPGTLARVVGLEPLLCLTKADLAAPDELLAAYGPLGIPYVVIGRPLTSQVLAPLRKYATGRISVLVGHSGVGKSTLVNALVPDADRVVGEVSPVTGRGRHTSSSVVALPLPGGGWIIDTPGLRSFGLAHVTPDRLVRAFPDLAGGVAACPPGCTHSEADCALDDWVCDQGGDPRLVARLDSLRRLLRSREGAEPG
jgi:ribosome biogenesis GTPase